MADQNSKHFSLLSVVGNIHRILTKDETNQYEPQETTLLSKAHTPKENKHKWAKSALKSIAILGAGTLAVAGSVELYQKLFSRYERPDYALTPGVYCYERASSHLIREELSFYSDNVRLAGYYYPVEAPKGLVVFAHGFHAGADDYLPIFEYLTEYQYAVFAFDMKGTYDSDGDSTIGLPEVLVDLDAALRYVKSEPRFKNFRIFLLGHSCGGYAVTAVLQLHQDVAACAAIAPMNQAAKMIIEKGELYTCFLPTDILTDLPEAFLTPYQQHLFGDYARMTAVSGINSVHIPVLIAHGKRDMIVDYNQPLSVIGRKNELRSENVYYYVGRGEQSGHDSIWHSTRAVQYQKWVSSQYKEMNSTQEMAYNEKVLFYSQINHELYSEINVELFSQIIQMFDSTLYGMN